jgi:hypothetical protein
MNTSAGLPPESRSGANKPMTRRGCVLGVALWLVIMTVPFCAVLFAIRGEVSWHRGDLIQDRLWLVNLSGASGQESAAGVAYSATRLVGQPGSAGEPVCARTHVYFLLWRGHSDALDYCDCYQPRPAPLTGYDYQGSCP